MITYDLYILQRVIDTILWISMILTVCFNVGWLIKCVIKFCVYSRTIRLANELPIFIPSIKMSSNKNVLLPFLYHYS